MSTLSARHRTAIGGRRYQERRLSGAEEPHPPGSAQPAQPRSADAGQARGRRAGDPRADRRHARAESADDAAQPVRAREHHRRRAARAVRPRAARGRCSPTRRSRTSWSTDSTRSTSSGTASSKPTEITFKDERHLLQIIERIVSAVGRRIDESSPMVDARLADGSRVNAIIPPLALDGPALSIRRFRTDKLGADDLVGRESLDDADAGLPRGGRRLPAERHRLRRHRRRQDDAAQRPVRLHRRARARRHDRGRGGADAPPAPRGAPGDAAGRTSKARARYASASS